MMGPIKAMMTAGQAEAMEYPITPNHDKSTVAPISVVPYRTQAPMPEAKNDIAIEMVLADSRAERKKSAGLIFW